MGASKEPRHTMRTTPTKREEVFYTSHAPPHMLLNVTASLNRLQCIEDELPAHPSQRPVSPVPTPMAIVTTPCTESWTAVATAPVTRTIRRGRRRGRFSGGTRTTAAQSPARPALKAIALMRMWRARGVSTGVVAELDAPELAAMLASYMLGYRERLCDKFAALHVCLERFFDENFICGAALAGRHALQFHVVYPALVCALDADKDVGAKLGLKNAIRRFFSELEITA